MAIDLSAAVPRETEKFPDMAIVAACSSVPAALFRSQRNTHPPLRASLVRYGLRSKLCLDSAAGHKNRSYFLQFLPSPRPWKSSPWPSSSTPEHKNPTWTSTTKSARPGPVATFMIGVICTEKDRTSS